MILEEAQKEFVRLRLIAQKSKNPHYRVMAQKLSQRVKDRHLFRYPSEEEISKIIKGISKESDNFPVILKRNITREYGNMVYKVWEQYSTQNT